MKKKEYLTPVFTLKKIEVCPGQIPIDERFLTVDKNDVKDKKEQGGKRNG